MIRRIWTAYTVELIKARRLWFTYIGPVLVVLAVLGAPLLRPIERDGVSDYGFIAYATPVALNLLGLVLLLTYCAGLISSELSGGSIRMVLVRPLRRCEFLAAKLLLGMTYAVVLTVLVGMTSWLLAFTFGELAGVSYGGEVIYTAGQMRNAYLLGMLLSLVPQFAAVAYALMLSTFTRNTGAAIGAAIGLWIVLDTLKHPLRISPYLFSTYLEVPWKVFSNYGEMLDASWLPAVKYGLATSVASFVLFAFIAGCTLSRRNLHA